MKNQKSNQKSILGFFQKSSPSTPPASRSVEPASSSPAQRASEGSVENKGSSKSKKNGKGNDNKTSTPKFQGNLTPIPSSDFVGPEEEEEEEDVEKEEKEEEGRRKGGGTKVSLGLIGRRIVMFNGLKESVLGC